MTNLNVIAMPTVEANAYRKGEPDANGMSPERHTAGPGRNPCRHCLNYILEGEEMLILAYRPIKKLQPYAELGPIFLHGRTCTRYEEKTELPPMFKSWQALLVRGYNADGRIVYGTGAVVPTNALDQLCRELLDHPEVNELHIRTSQYNCFQCRISKASS